MKDQIEALTKRGATAVYTGDANRDAIVLDRAGTGCGGPLSVCVHQPRNAADRTTVARHDCVTSIQGQSGSALCQNLVRYSNYSLL